MTTAAVGERLSGPIHVSTHVSPVLRDELGTLAAENDRSLAAEVRVALRRYIDEQRAARGVAETGR